MVVLADNLDLEDPSVDRLEVRLLVKEEPMQEPALKVVFMEDMLVRLAAMDLSKSVLKAEPMADLMVELAAS